MASVLHVIFLQVGAMTSFLHVIFLQAGGNHTLIPRSLSKLINYLSFLKKKKKLIQSFFSL
jgi:hypothetical protein